MWIRVLWSGLLLLSVLGSKTQAQEHLNERLDCVLIEGSISTEECLRRGCHHDTVNIPHVPHCFLQKNLVGYTSSVASPHANGFESTLTLKQSALKVTPNIAQIGTLKLTTTYVSENILRIKIEDPHHARYEVPVQSVFTIPKTAVTSNKTNYEVSLGEDFHLVVSRKGSQTKLIDTSIGGLVYSDQFIQFATYLASKDVYGMGENYHLKFKRTFDYTTLPIFARDHGVGNQEINYYGHHPFLTVMEHDGKAHGIFLLNSNAMSYTLLPAPAISYRMVGGILDFFIFLGDNPEHVVQLYTSIIGRSAMPPFWALGFQHSRYGYKNLEDMKKVVKRNLDHHLPLDTLYLDIDYMDEYRDFTYSPTHFADLPKYINETKASHNLRWALIIDPAIQAGHKDYRAFDEGYKQDVFIHWPKELVNSTEIGHPKDVPLDKGVLYGHVWPKGPAAFPDFLKNRTVNWWKDMLKHLHTELKFDAIWIDMNEPSNFENTDFYKCPKDKYHFTHPQMKFTHSLDGSTICMVARQGEHDEYIHYDVHSLYGWSESRATISGIHEATGKRGFALSRSTYPSSGKYAAHWLGDNTSNWEQLKQSIVGILEFSLFGLSFTGADICGFGGKATPELCKRWLQLGAYYPFSRAHNSKNSPDQDPGHFAEIGHSEVTESAVAALRVRYQLLHYLYTAFYRSEVYGDTVMRPMHHEFPLDSHSRNIDHQFFLGSAVLVNPFLEPNQTSVNAYVPEKSEWYRMVGQDFVEKATPVSGSVHLPDSESHRPLLLRAGSIVPMVGHLHLPSVVNTANLRKVPIELWVLPNSTGSARGELFYDDGDSIDTVHSGHYDYFQFHLDKCHLTIEPIHLGYQPATGSHDILKVDSIKISLESLHGITSANLALKLDEKESSTLKAEVTQHSLHLTFAESLNLFQTKTKVTISFTNKSNGQCFTH